jgi:geranylgeranyl diphosphate synthase type II
MFSLPPYLNLQRARVDRLLEDRLPPASTRPAVLHEALRYSVFGEAKRVRPILALAAAQAVGGPMTRSRWRRARRSNCCTPTP